MCVCACEITRATQHTGRRTRAERSREIREIAPSRARCIGPMARARFFPRATARAAARPARRVLQLLLFSHFGHTRTLHSLATEYTVRLGACLFVVTRLVSTSREPSQPGTTHASPPSSIDVKRAILIRRADALHKPRPQIGRPPLLPQLELPPPSTAVGADCAHHLRGALGPGVELELGAGAGAEVRAGVGLRLRLVWGLG